MQGGTGDQQQWSSRGEGMTPEKRSLGAPITPHRRGGHSVIPLTGKSSRNPDGELSNALFLSCCHETHAVSPNPPQAGGKRLPRWFRPRRGWEFLGCGEVGVRIPGEACFWVGAGWAPGPGAAHSSEWGLMKTNDLGRLKG